MTASETQNNKFHYYEQAFHPPITIYHIFLPSQTCKQIILESVFFSNLYPHVYPSRAAQPIAAEQSCGCMQSSGCLSGRIWVHSSSDSESDSETDSVFMAIFLAQPWTWQPKISKCFLTDAVAPNTSTPVGLEVNLRMNISHNTLVLANLQIPDLPFRPLGFGPCYKPPI